MRILFVAMTQSIHTARWISQLTEQGWDIHVINSNPTWGVDCHPYLKGVTVHGLRTWPSPRVRPAGTKFEGFFWSNRRGTRFVRLLGERYRPNALCTEVARLIDKLRPDLVHSLELQHSAYLVARARQQLRNPMPKWFVTNWGSDIFFYGNLEEHRGKIEQVMSQCDFYSCETHRDVELGKDFGFRGRVMLPVMPNIGGFDLRKLKRLRMPGPTSARPVIALKGYQHMFGRALTALKAIEMCAALLRPFRVEIHSVSPEVKSVSEIIARRTGLQIRCLPHTDEQDRILEMHGRARVSIGVSISDGASISFLEAFAMGAFPIQSHSAEPHEWIQDGETGFIVDPEDPHDIARALRRALTDDALVDAAAETNWAVACERLCAETIKPRIIDWYRQIMQTSQGGEAPHNGELSDGPVWSRPQSQSIPESTSDSTRRRSAAAVGS